MRVTMQKFLSVAEKYTGLKEVLGKDSNKVIDGWFNDLGYPRLKDDTPWCSLFANVVVKEAGFPGTGSLAARSWLKWGKPLAKPVPGCVVVLKRGNSSWEGHVGFFLKEDSKYIYLLGGNQANEVNVSRFSKAQLLGYRQPAKLAISRTAVSAAGSGAASVGAQLIETTSKVQSQFAGIPMEWAKYGLAAVGIALIFLTIYYKWSDITNKG
jgi:uncharacterized protein (TIGR02594 family)